MFRRNLWLKVPLLFAVVGHASFFEALTARVAPWWQVGVVLTIAAIVIPLLGEFLADEADSVEWRRRAWAIAAGGALLHLALDAACFALPWLASNQWKAGVAGALAGAIVMTVLLRGYVAALRHPAGLDAPARIPRGRSWPARLWRGAYQFGGPAILTMVIGLAFVSAAAVLLVTRPHARGDMRLWGSLAFFAGCATMGLFIGLERRALLLGRPGPRLWRGRRRAVHVVSRDGLLFVNRRVAFLYPWDEIEEVRSGPLFGTAAVAIFVRLAPQASPRRVLAGEGDARARARLAGARAFHLENHDADLVIASRSTESGPGPLLRELHHALAEPAWRATLPASEEEISRLRAR